jgi:hypothetical protein
MSVMNKHPDAKIIDRLGGPAELARALGFDTRAGGIQRVQNWKYRGIPEIERLRNPDVFGPAPEAHPPKRRTAAEGAAATNEDSVSVKDAA